MNSLHSVQTWLIRGIVFLLPLFFLPITSEFFDFNKLALLVFGSLAGVLVWALAQTKGEFRLRVTSFDLPVLAFALVVLASAIIVTPNKVNAFVFPGTATLVVFGTLLYFLVTQASRREEENNGGIIVWLLAGGALAGLIALLSGIGVLPLLEKLGPIPAWLTQPTFNTLGGILPAITLFVALLPLSIARITGQGAKNSALGILVLLLLVGGLAASAYQALPGKDTSPRILPVEAGWGIALETLKREPLLGVGPGNFVEAFNRFRTVEYNTSSVWNLRFGASSNWYFEVWTVTGLLGIVAFLWLVWKVVREPRSEGISAARNALLASLILLLLVPGNFALVITFYILLGLVAGQKGNDLTLQLASTQPGGHARSNLMPGFFAILALAGIVGIGLYSRGIYAAEVSYRTALNSVAQNDGGAAYNQLIETVNLNPQVDRYRITYSQINLALANSIAGREDLTDQDRETVSQLIQQSIREAQAAVATNRGRASNWENLARIYQQIMPFADDADQFAISTYQQAIALDPVNPNLRIALGGVYYSLEQYENAVRVFELAVSAKSDLANAHYNLGAALREKGDTQRAAQEMARTLNLVSPGTPDYDVAQRDLDELQAKLSEEATESAEVEQAGSGPQPRLQAPSPAPAPVIEPPLDLGEDAAPPATDSAGPTNIPPPEVSPSP